MRTPRPSILQLLAARSRLGFALAAFGLTFALGVAPNAHAEIVEAPESPSTERARQHVHLEDSDSNALFELRDERGGLLRCIGRCELSVPEGRYHVRVAHGGSVDETDLVLLQPTTVRGRTSSYIGVGLGIPIILGGVITGLLGTLEVGLAGDCMDCTDAEYRNAQAKAPAQRRDGYLLVSGGVLAVVGGIYLITTSHGSSLTAENDGERTGAKSLSVAVLPNAGGASLALSGRF